jgi:ATP-dependent protease ClpP protease subunit
VRLLLAFFVLFSGCAHAPTLNQYQAKAEAAPAPKVAYAKVGPVYVEYLADAAAIIAEHAPVIYLSIDSPGGSVGVGLRFIKIMREAKEAGSTIHCSVDGMAASMAAVILQECDVRIVHRQSMIMFHGVSVGGAEGNQQDFERLVQDLRSVNKMLAIMASHRLTISLAEYEARVLGTDWWLGWEEALEVGAADYLR